MLALKGPVHGPDRSGYFDLIQRQKNHKVQPALVTPNSNVKVALLKVNLVVPSSGLSI
jgi:hypothetical protein